MATSGEIRSLNHDERSYVEFVNRSPRKVAIFWHDYAGTLVRYAVMSPGGKHKMNTFVTHPWSVTDSESGDTLKIDNEFVFYPRLPEDREDDGVIYEKIYIDLPVYPLWIRCLQTLRKMVDSGDIDRLQIPVNLRQALKYVPDIKYTNYSRFTMVNNS